MGAFASVDDFLDMLRRHALIIGLVTLVGCIGSLIYAANQQHVYQSVAVIQATQPKVSGAFNGTDGAGSAAHRLQQVEQRLMARNSVLSLIDRYNIYPHMQALPEAEQVAQLRQSVRIDSVAAAGGNVAQSGSVSIITVTANLPTARQAQLVANDLTQATMDLLNAGRIEQAEETLLFFRGQEEALRREVLRVEDARAEFRRANNLTLNGEMEFRRSELGTLNEGLLDIARNRVEIERAIDLAEQDERKATRTRKISDLNEQLETLNAQRSLLQTRKAELEAYLATSPEVDRQLGAFDREMTLLREDLAEATEQRQQAEIAFRLEKRAQAERLVVLEPAPLPEFPITGSRKKQALAGAIASFLAGIFVAFLLDLRKPVLRSAAQMERELGFRPVVTVPMVTQGNSTGKPRRWFKRA